jgi:hypothetical protein
MLDDAADIESLARPAARSRDSKAAIKYLEASGATAISLIETETGCAFRVGSKIDSHAVSVQWIPEPKALAVARRARRLAGNDPDSATAARALARAAADLGAMLTHHIAMTRARDAAARIEQHMDFLRRTGKLREFTKAYKRRRIAARERGEGFRSCKVAEQRFR